MIASRHLPSAATMVLAWVVALGPAVPTARAQDSPSHDRHVTIWRTEGGRLIDLDAVRAARGFLGVGLLDLTPELRRHFGVPEDRGIMISRIAADSPAEKAGLRPADILTTVDAEALLASSDLSLRVSGIEQGGEIELERWRDGSKAVVRVPIEIRRREQIDISPLVLQSVHVDPARVIKVRQGEGSEIDRRWLEEVVETVGDSFSEATFVEQLEALRRERQELLTKLRDMERRLGELETELDRLHEQP